MSTPWVFLTYVIPSSFVSCLFGEEDSLESKADSSCSNKVKDIVKNILLNDAKDTASPFHIKTKNFFNLKNLSDSEQVISNWVEQKLKIIDTEKDSLRHPTGMYSKGSDFWKKKYYIAIHQDTVKEEVLPFCIAREVSHIINQNERNRRIIETITTFVTAFIVIFILEFSLLPSFSITLLSGVIVGGIVDSKNKKNVNNFAASHFSKEIKPYFEAQKAEQESKSAAN